MSVDIGDIKKEKTLPQKITEAVQGYGVIALLLVIAGLLYVIFTDFHTVATDQAGKIGVLEGKVEILSRLCLPK